MSLHNPIEVQSVRFNTSISHRVANESGDNTLIQITSIAQAYSFEST